jgi:hypothetical protein
VGQSGEEERGRAGDRKVGDLNERHRGLAGPFIIVAKFVDDKKAGCHLRDRQK